jgi:putative tRNA adenosine deaminase-associated protein
VPHYFAAALSRTDDDWSGRELDMSLFEDLDGVVEHLRDLADGGTTLLFLEEDDEYLAIVRVDGDRDPRAFISDDRAVRTSALAALLMEDLAVDDPSEDDEEEGVRPDPEAAGDTDVVADLGTPADTLVELCAEEGMLPGDIITAICEKAGCGDVLDTLRG